MTTPTRESHRRRLAALEEAARDLSGINLLSLAQFAPPGALDRALALSDLDFAQLLADLREAGPVAVPTLHA